MYITIDMLKKSLLITILFSFIITSSLAKDNTKLYKIKVPDRKTLNFIEQAGGSINNYVPTKNAEVYLTGELVSQLKSLGYQLILLDHDVLLNTLDSLASDHLIGTSYHSYEAVTFILDSLANLYPAICEVISIGQTVEEREMWAVHITDNPGIEEAEPEIKLVANIHGDEMISQEMMLIFIEYLLQNYISNNRVQQFINHLDIWIVPNMNFDGSQELRRSNANYIDLNRNFPDRDPEYENPDSLQAEVINIINWSLDHNFVLSAGFHSGALVVNYPWDRNLDGTYDYAATPDDYTFIRLALAYAKNNITMYNSEYFTNGITNGAEWYPVIGGMMDWNYHYMNCMDLTIELSDEKIPDADSLSYFWENNCESLLNLLEQVNTGIRGIVTDSITGVPLHAEIKVSEIGKSVFSDRDLGDYYRLLEPGNYQLLFEAEGYYPELINDVTVDTGGVTALNIKLEPIIYFNLSGNIRDSISTESLENVKIYIYQSDSNLDTILTDESGNYSVILPVGYYDLLIQKEEYFDKHLQLNLFDDTTLDIHLLKIIPGQIIGSLEVMDNSNVIGSIVYCQNKTDTLFYNKFFEIDSLIPGNIKIFAYKFGFKTTQIDTFLENGGSLNLNISVWPGSNEYIDDFELKNNTFTGSGDWQHDISSYGPYSAYSGDYVWATNPHGDYSSGPLIQILRTNVFSIQGMVIPKLELYHWYDIESNYDGANVKISNNYGRTWQVLNPNPDYPVESLTDEFNNPMAGEPVYSGKMDSWERISFNLSDYIGWPFIKFRFDLGVDEQKNAAGWYLDNFRIFDANATEMATQKTDPIKNSLKVTIYPNPANPSAKFSILTSQANLIDIFIYNIQGQLIYSASIQTQPNQLTNWQWDGVNFYNHNVASGVYFTRIVGSQKSIVQKIVLIR